MVARLSVSGLSATVVSTGSHVRVKVHCPVHKTEAQVFTRTKNIPLREFAHLKRIVALAEHERDIHGEAIRNN